MLLIAMPYCISKSCSVVSDSLQPHRLYSPWNSPGQNTGVSRYWKISRGSSHPGIEPRSPALQVDSLPAEPLRGAQEYWSGWPIPSPADLSEPGIEPGSPALQTDSLPTELPGNWLLAFSKMF